MKRFFKILLVIPIIYVVTMIFIANIDWSQFFNNDYKKFNNSLKEKIKAGNNEVLIKDLTDFSWNYVCNIPSYENIKNTIKKETSQDIMELEKYGEVKEGDQAYIFIQENKVKEVIFMSPKSKGYLVGGLKNCGNYRNAKLQMTSDVIKNQYQKITKSNSELKTCDNENRKNNKCFAIFIGKI